MLRTASLISLLIFVVSCRAKRNNIDWSENGITLIMQDDHSGMDQEQLIEVRDQNALEEFFAIVNRTRKPGLDIPVMDFSKEWLLIWCSGESDKTISRLLWDGQSDSAVYFKKEVSKRDASKSAVTSPFYVYKIPLNGKEIIMR